MKKITGDSFTRKISSVAKKIFLPIVVCFCSLYAGAQSLVTTTKTAGAFDISASLFICVAAGDHPVVQKAASLLQQDIEAVTGKRPGLVNTIPASAQQIIIIGSLDRSVLLRDLIGQKKFNPGVIKNQWEAYQLQTVANPVKGVGHALVIAGSDRRGTAFGVFELSRQIGVSPWYWWADVPVKKSGTLYIKANKIATDAPKVKYRGIFINDEAPALSGWSKEKFGGFNHLFYAKVFELMLRLKANYIWPAMWGNAFYDDDSLNIKTADEYAIVIGTSHHEPLMRAHDEWRRYGQGKWNYDSNEVRLKQFWQGGMQRATNEKIVSIGMRGDGDEPMSRQTATALLERIVKDQRQIIQEVTGKLATETPQLWALYKEVQDYYDKGMRVPDDVTLLLCDDNWGNIRKLPRRNDKPRKGGYGIYYHFDYVGGPRNYKWLNTNPIPRVWEQMHLAWQYGVKDIWIVNVGDIKPMEFPISFFLDYAWNPDRTGAADLQNYTRQWSAAQFGSQYAVEIADIIARYTKYNGRRKPELLSPDTYSLHNYGEADQVVNEYNDLLARAERINEALPASYRDAYFQLVLHPVKACANLNELYVTVAKNRYYAAQRWAIANNRADRAKQLYINDSLITLQYHAIANGKWNHMMDQTHIGYTYWQQPLVNRMPDVRYVPADSLEQEPLFDSVLAPSARHLIPARHKGAAFYEVNGFVSIGADHYTRAVNTNGIAWRVLPDHGRTGSAVTPFPVTAPVQKPGGNAPRLEYDIYLVSTDSVKIQVYLSPTLNFHNDEGLKYAVSIDNEPPQVVTINKDDSNARTWEGWVANNIIIKTTKHFIDRPGRHVLKIWMVNPGVVTQKIVMDTGGLAPSYLGPPETMAD
ncbi:MAG: glycosyl hydrolase 115 family protein [Chitinophagaceae bacterium]